MKILILGAGQVGSSLCKNLAKDKQNDLTVIDIERGQLNALNRHLDIKTICGDVTHTANLEAADIVNMDLVIAVTTSDEKNMIACQIAHTLYGTRTKIARVREAQYLHRDELFSNQAIPIDFVITPEVLITKFIHRIIQTPGAMQVREFENGLVNLVETRVFANTPIADKPIKELHQHLPKTQMRIVQVFRNNTVIKVDGNTIIRGGDNVYFLAEKPNITKVLKEFRRKDKAYRRIMIAGGGGIGYRLATQLEGNYRIHIIEINQQRAQKISHSLQSTTVIHGNASDEVLLIEEGIEQTDLFLALTDSDEINVIVSILAKKLGAHKTVALVKRDVYENLALQSTDIDMVISPDHITASRILSYIRHADTMRVYSLRQGNAEALEVIAHKNKQSVVGNPIWKIPLPSEAVIGCIVRNNKVIMASGNLVIEDGDHVLLMLTNMDKIHQIEVLFQAES